ncbi:MAG: hypothetical protein ACJ78X_03335 [Myxococcales bacterium]
MARGILLSMLVAAACAKEVTVHVRGGDRPPDPDFLFVANGSPAPLAGGGDGSVDRFRMVLRNLRLQSEPTDGINDTPGIELIGPGVYLVDLRSSALANGVFTELIGDFHIDAKGFYEMDLDLSPVTGSDVQANPELLPLLGKTFLIEGRNAQGAAFVFQSSVARVLLREAVFRMGLNHNNLDVNIAANAWFRGPDGAPLDPASADPAVRLQIEENVAASIDAYEDDDMDGNPDPLG